MDSLAARLLERRKRLNMSQEELAFRVGVSQRQISHYEHGKHEPTASVLNKLATELDTTTDYLLGRTKRPERDVREAGDLDSEERDIILFFRSQPPEQRRKIINAIKALA